MTESKPSCFGPPSTPYVKFCMLTKKPKMVLWDKDIFSCFSSFVKFSNGYRVSQRPKKVVPSRKACPTLGARVTQKIKKG